MKMQETTTRRLLACLFVLLLSAPIPPLPSCEANGRGEYGGHYKHGDGRHNGVTRGLFGQGHDRGNETTGQVVAWSLAAANLTVALSLIIRAVKRFTPLGAEAKQVLGKFNSIQKRYLMKFHYVLNPVILLLAVLHWTLSRCRSTALPEWGLLTMAAVVALGIVLKFRLCPKTSLTSVHKIHTQPALFLLLISMLLIGHLTMD